MFDDDKLDHYKYLTNQVFPRIAQTSNLPPQISLSIRLPRTFIHIIQQAFISLCSKVVVFGVS